jgi:hypothetical protein
MQIFDKKRQSRPTDITIGIAGSCTTVDTGPDYGDDDYEPQHADSYSSTTMDESSHSQTSCGRSSLRRKVKKEYMNNPKSDHEPKTPLRRISKDLCLSLSMEDFNTTLNQTRSTQSNRSLSSLGCSLRKSLRNILKRNNNDSSGVGRRERVRKQYDFDDNDLDGFANDDFDQDKLMVILSKELEIACDEEDE